MAAGAKRTPGEDRLSTSRRKRRRKALKVTHSSSQRPPVEYPSRPGSRKSVRWGFEDNTVWYDQKKKLGVSMSVCIRLSLRPPVFLLHLRQLRTLSRIKCESYIFITKAYGNFSIHIFHSPFITRRLVKKISNQS